MRASTGWSTPWPCKRCGAPIAVTAGAGRLAWSSRLALLGLGLVLWLGVSRWHAMTWDTALVAPMWLGLVALGQAVAARRTWRCRACNLRMGPRALPSCAPSFAVVIPTYNNEGSIEAVIHDVHAHVPHLPLMVVNDGSTDGTGQRAQTKLEALYGPLGRRALLLTQPRNRGKGAALQRALREGMARGVSHVVTLDGDGQHFARDITALVEEATRHPGAIVVGARDLSGENVSGASRFGRAFSNFWLAVQTGVRLADSQSGFRVYPTAPCLSLGASARAYDFEVEVLTVGARAGLGLRSVPIGVHYPPAAERVSHFRKWRDNARISWLNTRLLAMAPLWPLGYPARLSREPPPPGTPRAWSAESKGTMLGHLVFWTLLRVAGRRPAYALLWPVTFYYALVARRAMAESAAWLDVAEGPARHVWHRFWRSFGHMLTFGQSLVDRALVQTRGPAQISYTSEGEAHVRQALAGGRGAIFLSAHLGNYEVGGALFNHAQGTTVNVVMLDNEARAIRAVERAFGRRAPVNIIAINRGTFPALEILAALRRGEIVALHGDRVISDNYAMVPFFGRLAPFSTGVFMLAASAKAPVLLTLGFKEGPTHYRFLAEAPRAVDIPRAGRKEALEAQARWYAERIEHHARRYPTQWYNFFDFWAPPAMPGAWGQSTEAAAGVAESEGAAAAGRAAMRSTKS